MGGDDGSITGNHIPVDVMSFTLHYYDDDAGTSDYKPISSSIQPFAGINMDNLGSGGTSFNYRPLYNGNIAAMAENIPKVGRPLLFAYRYDQLNRLTGMNTHKGLHDNFWDPVKVNSYQEQVSYDANGNIHTYNRNGSNGSFTPGALESMDDLEYTYASGTNRLTHVSDGINTYTVDIHSQDANNYGYDEIGNLTSDLSENIAAINWTVYGKIAAILKSLGGGLYSPVLAYTYDAAGNRISKTAEIKGGTEVTWYVRDAQGNVMSTYVQGDDAVNGGNLTQAELHMYGSSRLALSSPIPMWKTQAAGIS